MSGALLISTKEREVWTYENKRHLDRLAHMLNSAHVGLRLTCKNPICPAPLLVLEQDDTNPAGRVLTCGCKRRFFEPKRTKH